MKNGKYYLDILVLAGLHSVTWQIKTNHLQGKIFNGLWYNMCMCNQAKDFLGLSSK